MPTFLAICYCSFRQFGYVPLVSLFYNFASRYLATSASCFHSFLRLFFGLLHSLLHILSFTYFSFRLGMFLYFVSPARHLSRACTRLWSAPNRPFARSGHMVQNHTCWWASCVVGLLKQNRSRWTGTSCIVWEVPLCNLLTSKCEFVPRDRIVQRAYLGCEVKQILLHFIPQSAFFVVLRSREEMLSRAEKPSRPFYFVHVGLRSR